MKSVVAVMLLSLSPLAAETLEMNKPVSSVGGGLEITVMANPVGTVPSLAQYTPRPRAGMMILIKNRTALPEADTFLLTVSYREGDKIRQMHTVAARITGVNANYTSAIVWIDPKVVQWVTVDQAKSVPMDVQFGPTAQFEVLGESIRLDASCNE